MTEVRALVERTRAGGGGPSDRAELPDSMAATIRAATGE